MNLLKMQKLNIIKKKKEDPEFIERNHQRSKEYYE